jgi:hypothetical protein
MIMAIIENPRSIMETNIIIFALALFKPFLAQLHEEEQTLNKLLKHVG